MRGVMNSSCHSHVSMSSRGGGEQSAAPNPIIKDMRVPLRLQAVFLKSLRGGEVEVPKTSDSKMLFVRDWSVARAQKAAALARKRRHSDGNLSLSKSTRLSLANVAATRERARGGGVVFGPDATYEFYKSRPVTERIERKPRLPSRKNSWLSIEEALQEAMECASSEEEEEIMEEVVEFHDEDDEPMQTTTSAALEQASSIPALCALQTSVESALAASIPPLDGGLQAPNAFQSLVHNYQQISPTPTLSPPPPRRWGGAGDDLARTKSLTMPKIPTRRMPSINSPPSVARRRFVLDQKNLLPSAPTDLLLGSSQQPAAAAARGPTPAAAAAQQLPVLRC